eukprot:3788545-Prymnesium_polylepis.2
MRLQELQRALPLRQQIPSRGATVVEQVVEVVCMVALAAQRATAVAVARLAELAVTEVAGVELVTGVGGKATVLADERIVAQQVDTSRRHSGRTLLDRSGCRAEAKSCVPRAATHAVLARQQGLPDHGDQHRHKHCPRVTAIGSSLFAIFLRFQIPPPFLT